MEVILLIVPTWTTEQEDGEITVVKTVFECKILPFKVYDYGVKSVMKGRTRVGDPNSVNV